MLNYLTLCKIKRIITGGRNNQTKNAVLLSSYYYFHESLSYMQLEMQSNLEPTKRETPHLDAFEIYLIRYFRSLYINHMYYKTYYTPYLQLTIARRV